MQTIMVTGGAGFIGGTFVRRYVESYRIVNLDALTYAGDLASLSSLEKHPNHIFAHGDIQDSRLVNQLLNLYQPFGIVHFAAESHVDRSIGAPAKFIETNVLGTQNLLECCRAYWSGLDSQQQLDFRFLHVSTDEVYGSLGPTGKFSETTPYAPNSPYSASKAASDHLVRAYHHTYGLPILISNCSNNYGPFQFPEKLIPLMILNALEKKELGVYGDGMNVRDWLHVEDHCQALETILTRGKPGEVYNIGGNAERTNLDVVKTICRFVDELNPAGDGPPSESLIRFVPDRPGHDQRYAIDATKIETELGWQPKQTFESGIAETVDWYVKNRDWWEQVTAGGDHRKRLGLFGQPADVQWIPKTKPAENYVDGEIEGVIIKPLKKFSDDRGWLMEFLRNDELDFENHPVMSYVSETKAGVIRGPHEHVEQADYFGFAGPGTFKLYLWDSRPEATTYGHRCILECGAENPTAVVVPAGVVHAYQNISDGAGWVFNAPNRLYAGEGKQFAVDEIRHEEDGVNSPYRISLR